MFPWLFRSSRISFLVGEGIAVGEGVLVGSGVAEGVRLGVGVLVGTCVAVSVAVGGGVAAEQAESRKIVKNKPNTWINFIWNLLLPN